MSELKKNIAQAKKPNHHRWADLAETSVKEVEEWFVIGSKLCLDIEMEIKKRLDEIDHL